MALSVFSGCDTHLPENTESSIDLSDIKDIQSFAGKSFYEKNVNQRCFDGDTCRETSTTEVTFDKNMESLSHGDEKMTIHLEGQKLVLSDDSFAMHGDAKRNYVTVLTYLNTGEDRGEVSSILRYYGDKVLADADSASVQPLTQEALNGQTFYSSHPQCTFEKTKDFMDKEYRYTKLDFTDSKVIITDENDHKMELNYSIVSGQINVVDDHGAILSFGLIEKTDTMWIMKKGEDANADGVPEVIKTDLLCYQKPDGVF